MATLLGKSLEDFQIFFLLFFRVAMVAPEIR